MTPKIADASTINSSPCQGSALLCLPLFDFASLDFCGTGALVGASSAGEVVSGTAVSVVRMVSVGIGSVCVVTSASAGCGGAVTHTSTTLLYAMPPSVLLTEQT